MASEVQQFKDLRAGELVARSAIYPRYLSGSEFSSKAMLSPDPLDQSDKKRVGVLAISVSSMTILTSEELVHAYGCRTAHKQNCSLAERLGREPEIDERKFYRGYYDLLVGTIQAIESDVYTVQVKLVPEQGEDAHCEIRLVPKEGKTPSQLRNARTDIIVSLGRMLLGAYRHNCPSDETYESYTKNLEIPDICRKAEEA